MRVTIDDVTLVGTAHVSAESVEEVEATIRAIRPKIVCVELDENRLQALRDPNAWAQVPVLDLIREGKGPQLLAQIMLGSYQRRIGEATGVRPGEELLAAIDAAEEIGAEVVLADREVGITLRRAFQSMPLREKGRVSWELFKAALLPDEEDGLGPEDIDELLEEDVLTEAMEELAELAPSASHVLIDERDAYMATRILEARDRLDEVEPVPEQAPAPDEFEDEEEASAHAGAAPPSTGADVDAAAHDEPTAPPDEDPADPDEEAPEARAEGDDEAPVVDLDPEEGGDVVAVLGAGHLKGVRRRVEADERADPEALTAEASSSFPWGKAAAWTLTAAIAAVFAFLIYQGVTTGDFSALRSGAVWYLVLSGVFAALGCIIAGGHPLSIVVAFVASPLTSLHPAVAAGWFAGGVEAWRREPRVGDVEGLKEIYSFSDMRENNLVRVILVAALVNVGSIVGSWAGFAKLFETADLLVGVLW